MSDPRSSLTTAYTRLRDFLDQKMRMAHIYKPVMLEVLLTHGGVASIRNIAATFLSHDAASVALRRTRRAGHTALRLPVDLVYTEECASKADALDRERQLKRSSSKKKAALAAGDLASLKRLSRRRRPKKRRRESASSP